MGSVNDAEGNLHFWQAAYQDPYNKRLIFSTVEHCGDYARRKTTFCITRSRSAEPKVTILGPLCGLEESIIELIASDIITAFND